MKRVIILAAAAAIAVTATPALAKSKKQYPGQGYGQAYVPGPMVGYWAGIAAPVYGFRGNDPSLGHPSAAALSRASGRCVEDLGYGRFKYCGW
jgi:hypothetical protein